MELYWRRNSVFFCLLAAFGAITLQPGETLAAISSSKRISTFHSERLGVRVRRVAGQNNTSSSSCQPVLGGYRPSSAAVSSKINATSGVYILTRTGQEVSIVLFGLCLQNGADVAITTSDTCHSRVSLLSVVGQSNSSAIYNISTADVDPTKVYYFCVGPAGSLSLTHQGTSDSYLKIEWENPAAASSPLIPLWLTIIFVIILLVLSGLFSGLNLGLMSLDIVDLKVIQECGTERERKYAKLIQPLRQKGNYLLCTILLGNVLVNSSLTQLMDSLTGSGATAVVASTAGIVLFGEIMPQSICSRYGLAVGARTIWITRLFMVVTFPIAFPISMILDKILGEEIGRVFKREQLLKMLQLTKAHHGMAEDEMGMLAGVLKYKQKIVEQIMTKKEDMFLLDEETILDFDTLGLIQERGHSRIPVHAQGDPNDIIGLLFVKDLLFVDPDDKFPLKRIIKFYNHELVTVSEDTTLDEMLNIFKSGRSHMALVQTIVCSDDSDPHRVTVGIVTLEDILEEIIQSEIYDESDRKEELDGVEKKRVLKPQPIVLPSWMAQGQDEVVVSKHQLLAAQQYLCTEIAQFGEEYLSRDMLYRLVSLKSVLCRWKASDKSSKTLYECGKPADYFILLLEGHVETLAGGSEKFTFDRGPFHSFGVAALVEPTFVPDYTVEAVTEIVYLKITRDLYQRAVSASRRMSVQPDHSNMSQELTDIVLNSSLRSQSSSPPATPFESYEDSPLLNTDLKTSLWQRVSPHLNRRTAPSQTKRHSSVQSDV